MESADAERPEEEEEEEEEFLLWSSPMTADCYKILPAHSSTEGVYSGNWGPENYLASVDIEMHCKDEQCRLLLLLPSKELFAEVLVQIPLERTLNDVLDSSRYVVLTMVDAKHQGRTAVVGMGFSDRAVAFDFKTTLKDHVKRVEFRREVKIKQQNEPKKDYNSIPEGTKISINLGGATTKSRPASPAPLVKLDLPPPPGRKAPSKPKTSKRSVDSSKSSGAPASAALSSSPAAVEKSEDAFLSNVDFSEFNAFASSGDDPFANNSTPFAAVADPFCTDSNAPSDDRFQSADSPFAEGSSSDPFTTSSADPFSSPADPFASSVDPFAVEDSENPFVATEDENPGSLKYPGT